MQAIDLVAVFIRRLDSVDIPYMVTGSVACMVYGEPRLTHDIDLVAEVDSRDVLKIFQAFPENEFYCPPEEALRLALSRPQRGSFNVIHHATGFKADFYVKGRDPMHIWGLQNSEKIIVGDIQLKVAPPQYVILRKLEFYREGGSEKHLRDIVGVLKNRPQLIKDAQIAEQVTALGLHSAWQAALATLQKNR
jgi:hypothetical protein